MVLFINFKREVCNPLKIDDNTCVSLWKNVSNCFDFTERTGKECAVALTKRGILKACGTEKMTYLDIGMEDIGLPFEFHTHPKNEPVEFSEIDKLAIGIRKSRMACVGGWENGKRKILCVHNPILALRGRTSFFE